MKIQIELELSDDVLRKGGVSEERVREDLADLLRHGFSHWIKDSGFVDHDDRVIHDALR
jgi:hypothetical protein